MNSPQPAPTDETRVAFFQTTLAHFEQACGCAALYVEKKFALGRHIVRIRIAGQGMAARMTRAFDHLATPASAAPDFTVCLWDDASTQTQMPLPPWTWAETRAPRGEIYGYNTERFYTSYNMYDGILQLFDQNTGTGMYWTPDARTLPTYEWAAPLRTILHWFMQARGSQLLHAGAVGTAKGGVLLAGKGGSGKSTSVLACLNSDLYYAADDYCLVSLEPQPYVYSLFNSAKLTTDSVKRLPHLASAIAFSEQDTKEKAVLYLVNGWQSKLIEGFPLVALVLPRVRGGTDTTLVPATPADGVRALGLSTLMQLPRANAVTAQRIAALANALPCYFLELGTDLSQISLRLGELVTRELGARAVPVVL